jgi:hypothetical protein
MNESKLPGVDRLLEELEEQGVVAERSMDGVFLCRHECDLLCAALRRMRVREAFLTESMVMSVGERDGFPRASSRLLRRHIHNLGNRRTYLLGRVEQGVSEGARGYHDNEIAAIDAALLYLEAAAEVSRRAGIERASAEFEVQVGRVHRPGKAGAPC